MSRVALSNLIRSQSTQLISRNVQFGNSYRLQTPCTDLYSRSCVLTALQKRWASYSPKTQDDNKSNIEQRNTAETDEYVNHQTIAYYGPISPTIRKLKLLSLSACCLSVSLGPVLTFLMSPDPETVILKGGIAATATFLTASTTAALHWFSSPYIQKIRWQPGSDTFEAEMMTWLATPITKTIKFADVKFPDTKRPYVTFKANGEFYFVDASNCRNKALLAKLTPRKTTYESAFKNL